MSSFLEAWTPLIVRLARGHAGPRVDPDDLANDVASSLLDLQRRGRFDPDTVEVPEGYLRVVVRHAASRARRSRAREQVANDGDVETPYERCADDAVPTPEDLARRAIDRRQRLDAIKARLRPRDALAFALLVEDGLSIDEVAKTLGTTSNNVYQMRHRILTVAKAVEDDGKDSGDGDLQTNGATR